MYTDENGVYKFNKPSEYCLVEVDLETLPSKTGIDTNSVFLYPNDNLAMFTIYTIDDVVINEDNDVVVYNNCGDSILANYSVESTLANHSAKYTLTDSITVQKSISVNGMEYHFDTKEDLSEYSSVEKADYLYSNDLINAEQKANIYLQALKNNECDDMDCLTPIFDELFDYYSNHKNSRLAQEINQTLKFETDSNAPLLRADVYNDFIYTSKKTVTAGAFTMHYEGNSSAAGYMSSAVVQKYKQFLINLSTYYFTTNAFTKPNGSATINVLFNANLPGHEDAAGFASSHNGVYYIAVKYTGSQSDDSINRTLAHEIFHTIQFTYNSQNQVLSWFKEGGATWAGSRYLDKYLGSSRTHANKYLDTVSSPMDDFSNNGQYGLFLFCQYISQNYGDIAAIKRILEAIQSGNDLYSSLEQCPSSGTVDYATLFSNYQGYNADTSKYDYSSNSTAKYNNAYLEDTDNTPISSSVESLAAKHYQYSIEETMDKMTINFKVTSGDYSDAKVAFVSFKSDGSGSNIKILPIASANCTYTFNPTSTNSFSKATLAVCNTDTSGSGLFNFQLGITKT